MWATLAIAIGGLSLAGLPGTIGFVSRWTTARVLGQTDLEVLVLTLVAGASIGAGIIRGLAALFGPATVADDHPMIKNKRFQAITIAIAVALLILTGIVPGVTAPVTRAVAENYTFYK
jgi:formate hydrogenlyase subunit 3/multisubunit Na+/H+ antiporter MnhD subunit